MRRIGLHLGVWAGVLFLGVHASAQNSLDILEQQLNQASKQHEDAASEVVSSMLNELETAYGSPEAALTLYQKAGGQMPDATPVTTQNAYETPDEKAMRLAQDQANATSLATQLQLHCGLMRFAALFIIQPDKKGLHEEWIAWLKNAAQIYPLLRQNTETKPAAPRNNGGGNRRRQGQGRGGGGGGGGGAGPDYRGVSVKDSIISSYFGYHGWGDKEQGQWNVRSIPALYRKEILDPSRAAPSAETLADWDVFIAMKNADQPDNDRWNNIEYPSLQFERSLDDYALSHTMEKLQTLVNIVTSNPTHPQFNDWSTKVKQLLQDYRKMKAAAAPPASATDTSTASAAPAKT